MLWNSSNRATRRRQFASRALFKTSEEFKTSQTPSDQASHDVRYQLSRCHVAVVFLLLLIYNYTPLMTVI